MVTSGNWKIILFQFIFVWYLGPIRCAFSSERVVEQRGETVALLLAAGRRRFLIDLLVGAGRLGYDHKNDGDTHQKQKRVHGERLPTSDSDTNVLHLLTSFLR